MARFAAGVIAGMVISAVAGAAFSIRAQEDDEASPPAIPAEVQVAAIRVGIDARALHGAVVSTRSPDAVTYLQAEGMLERPPSPQPVEPAYGVWDRLVYQCEAPGIGWAANTGNGFYGGPQFTRTTWLAYGGAQFAPLAHQASRGQQIVVAERVLRGQGWNAWPVCSRRLGLRS